MSRNWWIECRDCDDVSETVSGRCACSSENTVEITAWCEECQEPIADDKAAIDGGKDFWGRTKWYCVKACQDKAEADREIPIPSPISQSRKAR